MLNNNFSKLVSLYKKYKKQQRNKLLLQLLGVVALAAGAYLLYKQTVAKVDSRVSMPKHEQKTTDNNITHNSPQQVSSAKPTHKSLQKTAVSTPKETHMPTEVRKRTSHAKQSRKKDNTFQLKVTQRKSLYKLLVDYKNTKSYNSAIKIAQFYLEEKEYDKAVKWAVEASKKDPTQAQSWIIYARAKKALGKPEVAKRALGIYLKHNYSQSAQDLLDSL